MSGGESLEESPDERWRLLVPAGAVMIRVDRRRDAVRQVRALPAGTGVALVGGRRLRTLAWRAGLRIHAEYVAMPSLVTPVAITQVTLGSLRWTAHTVLTVPSGVIRLHAPLWTAMRLVQRYPRLLARVPAGDRLVVGTR
ncbi:hypothetical protein GCM10010399_24620 [Dactylosporangium fulvum]|uniref:Uncharacterized protein n=1 Tax=Dactylosporangium fulvum TaxID=53359 RepID=A0ABY5WBN5_9ACTN|nr:hypothetical protein [Dactylosporangium fulvum]UWP85496.1 hypothetical protein Dfulv_15145 [Dactylosporangium fulvum]